MKTSTAFIAIGSGTIGFLAALILGSARPDPLPIDPLTADLARSLQRGDARLRDLELTVASLVDELRRVEPSASPAPVDRAAPEVGTATSATNGEEPRDEPAERENRAAYTASRDLVDDAISHGRWTADDAREFRTHLAALNRDQGEEILQSLVLAINRGDVQVDTRRGLF